MLKRSMLHEYQKSDVQFVKDNCNCGLFLEMSLGKTIITLTAIADLIEAGEVEHVIIIAPLRVAISSWHTQALEWEHTKNLNINVVAGKSLPVQRKMLANTTADITIINQDIISRVLDKSKKDFMWDMIIVDESQNFKNPKALRTKSLLRTAKIRRGKIKRKLILTGTPTPNSLTDIWSQISFLDFGERLTPSFHRFKKRYFREVGFMGYQLQPLEGASTEIHQAIGDITRTRTTQDHIDLPDRIDMYEKIMLPEKVKIQYKKLEKDFFIELESGEAEALSAAALGGKLLQMCNSGLYGTDGEYIHLHDEKLNWLKEFRKDNPEERLLTAYNYNFDRDNLLKAFPDAILLDKKQDTIERWNKGEIKMLLAHPASASEGLNLQNGGNTLVWYSMTWSLGRYLQFNARLHRQGQKKHVKVIHLIAQGGIDEKVVTALRNKAKSQTELIEFLKLYNAEF